MPGTEAVKVPPHSLLYSLHLQVPHLGIQRLMKSMFSKVAGVTKQEACFSLSLSPLPPSMAQFNNYLHVRYCVSSRDGLPFRESLCKFCPYASFSTKRGRVSVPGMGCCPRTYPNGIDFKGCLCLVPTCTVYARVCVIRTRLYTILPHASSWFQTLPYCMAESQVQEILHIPVSCPPSPPPPKKRGRTSFFPQFT